MTKTIEEGKGIEPYKTNYAKAAEELKTQINAFYEKYEIDPKKQEELAA